MSLLAKLRRDQAGAAIVEFALVAPTMVVMMMGVFELGHTMYVQSVVNGAMQEAGRDSTVERANLANIETQVRRRVGPVAPGAVFEFKRAFQQQYVTINRKEPFSDLDGDGKCNDGEPYEDLNDNGIRDLATGVDGQGNARDVVVFQVDVEYDRLFPMPSLSGWSNENTVVGRTILRNQPFRQQDRSVSIEGCVGPDDGGGSDAPFGGYGGRPGSNGNGWGNGNGVGNGNGNGNGWGNGGGDDDD